MGSEGEKKLVTLGVTATGQCVTVERVVKDAVYVRYPNGRRAKLPASDVTILDT